MNEYNISFTVPNDGGVLLDVHGTTGTSRYANFGSVDDLRTFFENLGLHDEKVAEIQATCEKLQPGQSYHEKMFLPEAVIEAIEKRIAEAHEPVETPRAVGGRTFKAA